MVDRAEVCNAQEHDELSLVSSQPLVEVNGGGNYETGEHGEHAEDARRKNRACLIFLADIVWINIACAGIAVLRLVQVVVARLVLLPFLRRYTFLSYFFCLQFSEDLQDLTPFCSCKRLLGCWSQLPFAASLGRCVFVSSAEILRLLGIGLLLDVALELAQFCRAWLPSASTGRLLLRCCLFLDLFLDLSICILAQLLVKRIGICLDINGLINLCLGLLLD